MNDRAIAELFRRRDQAAIPASEEKHGGLRFRPAVPRRLCPGRPEQAPF